MLELWLWLWDDDPRILAKKKEVDCSLFENNPTNVSFFPKGKMVDPATLGQHRITMIRTFEMFFGGIAFLYLRFL